jgi:hypothetical protein
MIKRRLLPVLAVVFVLVVAICSCHKAPVSGTPVIADPFAIEPWLTHGPEAPDDIVRNNTSLTYRANIRQDSITTWPPIEIANTMLTSGPETISINYRESITTWAGETRNILFDVTPENALQESHNWNEDALRLSIIGAPPEMYCRQQGFFAHLGILNTVLVIKIPENVKPGWYDFSIAVEFEGKDYGKLPCTVEVID